MTDENRRAGDGFLARWSERKRQAAEGAQPPEPEAQAAIAEREEREAEANREAAEAIDIDALEKDSDYTVFLKRGVPAALQRRALRKLWGSNPVLANLDGLNDYEENFADPALNMTVFKSAWQAGRGYLKDPEPEPALAADPAPEAAPETGAAPPEDAAPDPGPQPEPQPEPQPPPAAAEAAPAPRVPLRRRLGLEEA